MTYISKGVGIGLSQAIETRHPGYFVRSIVSALVSFIPYSGPIASWEVDHSDVNNYNIWTLAEKIKYGN